jgi:hypothetical protein
MTTEFAEAVVKCDFVTKCHQTANVLSSMQRMKDEDVVEFASQQSADFDTKIQDLEEMIKFYRALKKVGIHHAQVARISPVDKYGLRGTSSLFPRKVTHRYPQVHDTYVVDE